MRPQPSALPKEQHTIPHINHALWPHHPSDEIEGLVLWCGADVELVWWLRRCICVVWALPGEEPMKWCYDEVVEDVAPWQEWQTGKHEQHSAVVGLECSPQVVTPD